MTFDRASRRRLVTRLAYRRHRHPSEPFDRVFSAALRPFSMRPGRVPRAAEGRATYYAVLAVVAAVLSHETSDAIDRLREAEEGT